MADKVVGVRLEADTSGATTSLKSFKQELKLAQHEVVAMGEKFGVTSKEAADAARRAAELKDKIGDAKSLVDAFNPDTKFRAFGASINVVVGGFSALQGVLGLVGAESKQTEKLLLKVQSAMAISQGIAQLQEGVQTFRNLGAVIQATTVYQKANAAATALASGAMRLFGATVVTTSTGFQALKIAIASTGIGLLVVGLGVLIPKIMDWVDSSEDAEAAQNSLNASIERVNDSLDKNLAKIDFATKKNLLNAEKAGASEKELQDIKQQGLQKELTQLTVSANLKGSYYSRELAAKKLSVDEINKLGDDYLKAEAARQAKFEQLQLSGLSFEATTAKKQRQDAATAKQKGDQTAADAIKKRDAQLTEERERKNKDFTTSGGPGGGLNIEIPKTEEQIQIENTVAAAAKALKDKGDIFLAESNLRSAAENDIRDKANNQMAIDEQTYQNRRQLLQATGNLFSALGDLIGKETAAGKALAIAQATINTFLGATEVLRAPTVIPEPFGTPLKIANVATIIATGLSAIKNIVKAPVPGGSGAVPSMSALTAPLQPQRAQQQTTALDQQSLNAIGNATSRAFVLESDITNNAERVRRLNRAAKLGG